MDKLIELISRCKGSVLVEVNGHKDCYETVDQYLDERCSAEDIDPRLRRKMADLDSVIYVQFYPETPIGFHDVYHYDLDTALSNALNCLTQ